MDEDDDDLLESVYVPPTKIAALKKMSGKFGFFLTAKFPYSTQGGCDFGRIFSRGAASFEPTETTVFLEKIESPN